MKSKLGILTSSLAVLLVASGAWAQLPSVPGMAQGGMGSGSGQETVQALQERANAQNPFLGGVPEGKATAEVLSLTLKDAIQRGLRNNLGPVLSNQASRAAAAERWRQLSNLLPNLRATSGWTKETINLTTFGLPLPPGTPNVVGPFSVVDSRAHLTQNVVDLHAIENERASSHNLAAAKLSYQDARDVVVLAVAGLYFQVEANESRVAAGQARLATAEAIYQQSVDMKKAGVAAGIDVLRADVERHSEQQRLLMEQNDLAKSKLQLGRAIGLPIGQKFEIAEKVPFTPAPPITEEAALQTAYASRADYKAQLALVKGAENAKRAATAERLPTLRFTGDYGNLGRSNYSNAKATYAVGLGVELPIFEGGKAHGDELAADAQLQRARAQAEDLRSRVDFEVRSALLDQNSAAQQVQVAQEGLSVATEELTQARDRFAAGVADNLEVTRAQEAVANANENLIGAIFAHNVAKASLARAMGVAEEAAQQFLGGK